MYTFVLFNSFSRLYKIKQTCLYSNSEFTNCVTSAIISLRRKLSKPNLQKRKSTIEIQLCFNTSKYFIRHFEEKFPSTLVYKKIVLLWSFLSGYYTRQDSADSYLILRNLSRVTECGYKEDLLLVQPIPLCHQ